MSKSKAPTGLSITRSGNTYKFSWKIGDSDYGNGQNLWYRINNGAWNKPTIAKTATSYSVSNASVKTITFQVQGNRKKYKKSGKTINPGWSAWASKTWTATIPSMKSLAYENSGANQGVFKWEANTTNDGTAICTGVETQTCYVRKTATPSDREFGSVASRGTSGSQTVTEESEAIAAGNLVRWYRARAVGNAGKSGWKYASHAYGTPTNPRLTSASAVKSGSVSRITATWNDSYNSLKPIDTITLQYAIEVPTDATMSAPASGWEDAIEVKPNGSGDKIVVNVEDVIGVDECMWVRIKSTHDEVSAYSNEMLAQVGVLETPTINAVPNSSTGNVSITITEETSCTVANTAIFYRDKDDPSNDRIVAVFAHGTTTGTINVPAVVGKSRTCFGAYAFVGTYEDLSINPVMKSESAIDSDIVAIAPENVTVSEGPREGTVRIGWEWTWTEAHEAELAWDEYEEAWESTDEPDTYTVVDRYATSWVIADLEVGKRYYFRVRLCGLDEDVDIKGPWSQTVSYDLSSVPDRPVLTLSKGVINEGDTVTARWAFSGTEGVEQAFAEIASVTYENDEPVYGDIIAHVDLGQSVDLTYDWQTNTTYNLAVRVTTTSGMQTVWSEIATLYVAEPVTIAFTCGSSMSKPGSLKITETSAYTEYYDGEVTNMGIGPTSEQQSTPLRYTSAIYETLLRNGVNSVSIEKLNEHETIITQSAVTTVPETFVPSLKFMPFIVTITGAGETGTTTLSIVRASDYHVYRPDDKDFDGYEGETVATYSQEGESPITITVDDLIGSLDDTAEYLMIATVIDEYGQTASMEVPFSIDWMHKADVPGVEVKVDQNHRIAKITPVAPEGYIEGDVCDIYRLTADQPELVYKGAEFGTTYVDPYPAFGDFCGHRLVTRTEDGDYATATGIGWYDAGPEDGDYLDEQQMIIDVDGDQIELPYNITLSNKWSKDFKRTSYLGGSVTGDWNPAVTRDTTANTVLVRGDDLDKQLSMRDLAGYAGVAHIRTPDGSSLTCDIQIDEQQSYDTKKVSYTLTIQAIDPQEPVGMTLTEWEAMNELE